MVKYLLSFLFVFFMLSSFSFANRADDQLEVKLQREYGYDLTKAPFFLRFAYNKEFNRDWKKTNYLERKAFLENYEINLAASQAKEKADAKAAANKEKERLRQKKEALRKEKEILKAQLAKEKAEKLEDKERQKEFNMSVHDQDQTLKEMKRQATQGH